MIDKNQMVDVMLKCERLTLRCGQSVFTWTAKKPPIIGWTLDSAIYKKAKF